MGSKKLSITKIFLELAKIGDYKNYKNDGFKLIEKKFSEVMAKYNYF
jgi:hypothetical protein